MKTDYKLTHTSPPKKRVPKPKQKSKKEARHVYYENWKGHKAQKLQELLIFSILYWIGKVFLQKVKKIVLNYWPYRKNDNALSSSNFKFQKGDDIHRYAKVLGVTVYSEGKENKISVLKTEILSKVREVGYLLLYDWISRRGNNGSELRSN